MFLNETIVPIKWETNKYWHIICNADGSAVWWGTYWTTPYKMLAYYDNTDLVYDYEYYCEAVTWTLITDANWRVFRIQNNKNWIFISKMWAWWDFSNLWDELTVKALIYN